MSERLGQKVAIITGASKGIGKGIAKVFAREGAKLLLVSRGQSDLEQTASELRSGGADVSFLCADISQSTEMRKMADTALSHYGRLDILCQNAGIFPSSRIDEMSESEWDRVHTINLKGTFLAVKACLPAMQKQKYGRIVITSSITGPRTGQPGLAHYAATKGGINGFIKTAAIEFAKHNITVNAIEPGNILTEGMDGLGSQYIRDQELSIPLGRLGTPEDCAHAVLFLASDEARYITGQTIIVDGGQTRLEVTGENEQVILVLLAEGQHERIAGLGRHGAELDEHHAQEAVRVFRKQFDVPDVAQSVEANGLRRDSRPLAGGVAQPLKECRQRVGLAGGRVKLVRSS